MLLDIQHLSMESPCNQLLTLQLQCPQIRGSKVGSSLTWFGLIAGGQETSTFEEAI